MKRLKGKQKNQLDEQWFMYDVIPHNIRWKQEMLNKKYNGLKGSITSFFILLFYFFFTEWFVFGVNFPAGYILLEAVIIEIFITAFIRIMVASNRKNIQRIFLREEAKNVKGRFCTDYILIENTQGRQIYFYYNNLLSAAETEEAFSFSDKEQKLYLEKRYLTRDDILFIRNQSIHYCKIFEQFQEENVSETLIFERPIKIALTKEDRYRKAGGLLLSLKRTAYGLCEWKCHILAAAISALLFMSINLSGIGQPIIWGTLVVVVSFYLINQVCIGIKARKELRNTNSENQMTLHMGKNEIEFEKGKNKIIQKYHDIKQIIEGDSFLKAGNIYLWKEEWRSDEWLKIRNNLRKNVDREYKQIYAEDSYWRRAQITFIGFIIGFVFMGIFMSIYSVWVEDTVMGKSFVVERENQSENNHTNPMGKSDVVNEFPEQGTGVVKEKDSNFVFTPNKANLYLDSIEYSVADCYSDNVVNQTSRFYIENGTLYGISVNAHGELGVGNTEEDITAKGFYRIKELIPNVKHVAQGSQFMVYLNHKDELWGAGNVPGIGQSLIPVLIMDDVSFADCSDEGMIILKNNGTVWCAGRLKDSEGNELSVYDGMVQVLEQAKYVTAGKYVMAAIGKEHTLWMWGDNRHGQCGGIEQGVPVFTAPTEIRRNVKMIWADKLSFRDYEEYPLYASNEAEKENYGTYIQLTDGNMYACGETLDADGFIPVVVEERDN